MATNQHCIKVTKGRKTKRVALLGKLADSFRKPATAPWDREALRDSKRIAWPIR